MTPEKAAPAVSPKPPRETTSLIHRIMLGFVSLSDVPLKERRQIVKSLLAKFDTEPMAEDLVEDLLKGRIPDARPIGRMIASSKKRHILLQAWIGSLRDAATSYREERIPLDVKEVTARAQWITKQLGKMRSVPEDLAGKLLDAVVDMATLVLQLPTGQTAEGALVRVVTELKNWVTPVDERILNVVAASDGPYRPRAAFLRDLDAKSVCEQSLLTKMRELALRLDAEFAEYLFSTIPNHVERSRALSSAIRSGCDPKIAQQVLEGLMEQSTLENRAIYLDSIVALALEARELPPTLGDNLVEIISTVSKEHASPGAVAPVLYEIDAVLRSRYESQLEEARQEHEARTEEAEEHIRRLEEERHRLEELVESVKKTAREPERQLEHRTRVSSLTPICLIHQDIIMSLREKPDLRLSTFAQTIRGALTRQGVTPLGEAGESVGYDPSQHEHAAWAQKREGRVKIVAPGYVLSHPLLDAAVVVVRAVVEPIDTE